MCDCVLCMAWLVRQAGRQGWGGWLYGPMVYCPLGGNTEGARQALCLSRHQGGSRHVALLLVAERIMFR
jgi:hypothetical protein